jgi:uncharacterized membrane protein
MHIVAGTFASRAEALKALTDLEKTGIGRANMNVIEPDDRKGFEREHRPTRTAALRGALVGAILGIAVFGALLAIARADFFALGFLALYVCGIAMCSAGGALIFAMWNLGVSHDEALLFEEVREKGGVIAAIEVSDSTEDQVIHELEDHGARQVRAGLWRPKGWKHAYPTYNASA